MTQEDKDLLLKDLCGRLPYGVRVWYKYATWNNSWFCASINIPDESLWLGRKINKFDSKVPIIEANEILIKPYLRSLDAMTEEEKRIKNEILRDFLYWRKPLIELTNFYYSRHLDCNGLIPKGLALEATEGMYK